MDFLDISEEETKKGTEIVAGFIVNNKTTDLMTRAKDFYAVWVEERGLWSTDEQDLIELVDHELDKYYEEHRGKWERRPRIRHLRYGKNKAIDEFHHYCKEQLRENAHQLDEKLIFSNQKTKKRDYASKKLDYPLEEGSIEAWDKLMSVLYSDEERHKIEWAIGAIVSGDSKNVQKFLVFYGPPKSGKSTVINIIEKLFQGYCSVFDAKALGSANDSFAMAPFKSNPLVAYQHDGDLSHIEDNTRLNSIVSHETVLMNEKNKPQYPMRINSFLFMGTNKPVRITDGKSGLLRRLIDVTPTGRKIPKREYDALMKMIDFELGAIAWHCRQVYLDDPQCYDEYTPLNMLGASNDFYNFILDKYYEYKQSDHATLQVAYEDYKSYCDKANAFVMPMRTFKEELKNYFVDFKDRATLDDGTRVRSYYTGFRSDKFEEKWKKKEPSEKKTWLEFNDAKNKSLLDIMLATCPAQYANSEGTPLKTWDNCFTKLSGIDSHKLHYLKVPLSHIVIDFDIPDENGNKCFEKNLEEASKWPPTYAELSKSGAGIHLHYIYTGDPLELKPLFKEHVEVKVFNGNSSLRRMLTKCNDIPVATISSGLPLKEKKKVVNFDSFTNDKALITAIKRNLNKENVAGTKPSVELIYKDLEKAYASGMHYDVSKWKQAIYNFASNSTHHADYCIKLFNKMKFCSEDVAEATVNDELPIAFFDVEVFSNLLLICWKYPGKDSPVIRMINPSPDEVLDLMHNYRLIGFNCRRYDNHILYARSLGASLAEIYEVSKGIIGKDKNAFFKEAYNVSYTDIYDFSSKKQSLKKFEIDLGIHHKELPIPWDQPVPEERWIEVAEYCDNDVIATEAVWEDRKDDFTAREILADIAGMTVNDTTNTLTTRIIFGQDRNPQIQFNYRDLSQPVGPERYSEYRSMFGDDYEFRVFDTMGLPTYETYTGGELPDGYSILPFFPGYVYDAGKSTYLGEEIGEGGRVYSEPGMYGNIWDADVTSMHPHSIWAERLFGPKYSRKFYDLVDIRVAVKKAIKTGNFEDASKMMDGKLSKWLTNADQAGGLANALKIAINSVYGLTSARFENPFRDLRNKDNIVAKRGALFMTLLKQEVQKQGYQVAHIKTDSIKIPDWDQKIFDFVRTFGHEYGYNFETEAEFDRFCLVNDAVYIAHDKFWEDAVKKHPEDAWKKGWTATGTQFQVPYVFKTLFAKAPIEFEDLCETKSVTSALYLDMDEDLPEGEHDYQFVGRVGLFCPIRPGKGGGRLVREAVDKDGNIKYDSATGAKDYRWLESEDVVMRTTIGPETNADLIDLSYYDRLVEEAVNDISQYGDFEWFRAVN